MTIWETRWLNRLREHCNDKKMAEKCGLDVKDICVHQPDVHFERFKMMLGFDKTNGGEWIECIKCGELYR